MTHHLVLGGARSGKSSFAEMHALKCPGQAVYIATAQAGDQEMTERIRHHQSKRSGDWQLIEEPLNLAHVIREQNYSPDNKSILIDCLTLWLSNCLHAQLWTQSKVDFFDALKNSRHPITMVSNEVGGGIVPLGELSRRFVDEAGWLHQELATQCSNVTLVVAGIPSPIK